MYSNQFDDFKIALALNLRRLREMRNILPGELAAELGMSERNYYRLEDPGKGGVAPKISVIPILASFYQVSIDELFGLVLPSSSGNQEEAVLLAMVRKMPVDTRKAFYLLAGTISQQRGSAAKLDKIADLIRLMA